MEPKHVHHSYIWLGSITTILSVLFFGAIAFFPLVAGLVSDGDLRLAFFGTAFTLIALAVLIVLVSGITVFLRWLGWKHLTYQCCPETFDVRSGIFFKKSVHIPYGRIQGIDQKQGIIQRILGLCTVKIDTAAGSENESTQLPYLTKADAETLRIDLLTRKARALYAAETGATAGVSDVTNAAAAGAAPGAASATATVAASASTASAGVPGAPVPANVPTAGPSNPLDAVDGFLEDLPGVFSPASLKLDPTFQRKLSTKELILGAITNANTIFGGLIAAAIVGVCSIVSTIQAFGDTVGGFVGDFVDGAIDSALDSAAGAAADSLATHALMSMLPLIVTCVLGALLLVWAIAIVGTIVNLGGFTVRRVGDRVEVEHGLLSRNYHGINVARIQSVHIKQGFIRRLLGYCQVELGKIEGVNAEDSKNEGSGTLLIHPFMKVSEVDEFLAGLIPEFPTECTVGLKPAPVALRRSVLRHTIWCNGGFWGGLATLLIVACCRFIAGPNPDMEDQLLLTAVDIITIPLLLLFAFMILVGIPRGILWFRESQVTFGLQCTKVVNSGLSVTTEIIPRNKMQSCKVHDNPLQRLAKVQTITANSAAGTGAQISLKDLSVDDAEIWFKWSQPLR